MISSISGLAFCQVEDTTMGVRGLRLVVHSYGVVKVEHIPEHLFSISISLIATHTVLH